MTVQNLIFVFLVILSFVFAKAFPGLPSLTTSASRRLSKPLIGDDGRIYTCCSDRFLYSFQSNGSIDWRLHLAYHCNLTMAPVHGGPGLAKYENAILGQLFLVGGDRVSKINFQNIGTSVPAEEIFFGQEGAGEILGIAVSTLTCTVFINVKNRGLFAYSINGKLLWSAGPSLYQFGYRLGCRHGVENCSFASLPVIDQCEASLYVRIPSSFLHVYWNFSLRMEFGSMWNLQISNTKGEVYSLSLRDPHFNWVQDLSFLDKDFTITPGNNGRLYVTIPVKAILLALDVFTGSILWQQSIGPLSTEDSKPVVDSNGWISIGSLDGFLYSISPAGTVNKFTKATVSDSVIQVGPFVDCSGYAVYISQAQVEGKANQVIGHYNYVSAMRTTGVTFTLLVPATGTVYWSESYPGEFKSALSESDLKHFVADEGIILAFVTASKYESVLPCRSKFEKLVSTCSQANPKPVVNYPGNRRSLLLFLLFESIVLVVLAGLVRFCCIFWNKEKLQGQHLGSFLHKRRSLQQQKKALDRAITELHQKASEEETGHQAIEEISDLLRKRDNLERKLSTTYSLGRDDSGGMSRGSSKNHKTLLPTTYNGAARSYSFQGAEKESVTIFHAASYGTSSSSAKVERSTDGEEEDSSWSTEEEQYCYQPEAIQGSGKGKAAAHQEAESSSGEDDPMKIMGKYQRCLSEPGSSWKGLVVSPVAIEYEQAERGWVEESVSSVQGSSMSLKRRKASSASTS
ncbi:Protein GAMETE EXPRESSED 3 [Linum perenne]